jgi:hypothetical protein
MNMVLEHEAMYHLSELSAVLYRGLAEPDSEYNGSL